MKKQDIRKQEVRKHFFTAEYKLWSQTTQPVHKDRPVGARSINQFGSYFKGSQFFLPLAALPHHILRFLQLPQSTLTAVYSLLYGHNISNQRLYFLKSENSSPFSSGGIRLTVLQSTGNQPSALILCDLSKSFPDEFMVTVPSLKTI